MLRIRVSKDLSGVHRKITDGKKKSQMALTQQVVKDSNYYIPKDTGSLEISSLTASQFEEGVAIWDTPYARKMYWNPQYNFSKDVNPNARGLWFEAAKAERLNEWTKIAKEYY